ncbi:MAG: hypothetical protein O2971_09445 [Proteobacteria bacterium]|nr:hypothetical protein [Pseudomonadota bacterium]
MSVKMVTRSFLVLLSIFLLQFPVGLFAQDNAAASQFVRFIPGDGTWEGELQTAITTYENAIGVRVELVSAIHIAESFYYEELNRHFQTRDAVLFELVAETGQISDLANQDTGASTVSFIQRALANFLQLNFQLELIDYSAGNFIHADLSPQRLRQIMLAKNESFFSMFMSLALAQIATEQAALAAGAKPSSFNMISVMNALMAEDRNTAFKYLFAEELGRSEGMIVGPELENQLTILGDRNAVALQVLEDALKDGTNRRVSLFYGAAHMPGMERALTESMGFDQVDQRWLVAWQIP